MNTKVLSTVSLGAFTVLALAAVPVNSGLGKGESVTPFHPQHVSGPDKGTDTCPPCKYGNLPAVQAWFNAGEDTANVMNIAKTISGEVAKRPDNLKGFMIMVASCAKCEGKAKTLGADAEKGKLNNIAFAYVKTDNEAIANYKINIKPEMKNTILVYKDRKVVAKFVNLVADAKGQAELKAALESVR